MFWLTSWRSPAHFAPMRHPAWPAFQNRTHALNQQHPQKHHHLQQQHHQDREQIDTSMLDTLD